MLSKRFIVVSFFAAIAISSLCEEISDVLKSLDTFSNIFTNDNWKVLCYSFSFLIFMIKYYLDDIAEDRVMTTERIIGSITKTKHTSKRITGHITRRIKRDNKCNLALLVIAWIFFIFSSFLTSEIKDSLLFWLVGLIVITISMLLSLCDNKFTHCFKDSSPISCFNCVIIIATGKSLMLINMFPIIMVIYIVKRFFLSWSIIVIGIVVIVIGRTILWYKRSDCPKRTKCYICQNIVIILILMLMFISSDVDVLLSILLLLLLLFNILFFICSTICEDSVLKKLLS